MSSYIVTSSGTATNFFAYVPAPFGTMEGEYDEDEIDPAFEPEQRRSVAGAIVGEVDWYDELRGYCTCPGEGRHDKPTQANHCRIYIDRVPTIHCFHSSCKKIRAAKNRELRSKLPTLADSSTPSAARLTGQARRSRAVEKKFAASLETILLENAWPDDGVASAFAALSPIPVPTCPVEQTQLFLRTLFEPNDEVWIGSEFDSGKPRHRRNFRPVRDWSRCQSYAGEFTCASTFNPGGHDRRTAAIDQRRYVVVESDGMSFGQTAGVFQFLNTLPGWRLRAVVWSGNKSLHGWFEGAPLTWSPKDLEAAVCGLRCDPMTLRPSQPVRLPGALRTDTQNPQALLYLSSL